MSKNHEITVPHIANSDTDRINWLADQRVDINIHSLTEYISWTGSYDPDKVRQRIDDKIAQEKIRKKI